MMEQFLRLLHECGMPITDVDFINSDGPVMNKLLLEVASECKPIHIKASMEYISFFVSTLVISPSTLSVRSKLFEEPSFSFEDDNF